MTRKKKLFFSNVAEAIREQTQTLDNSVWHSLEECIDSGAFEDTYYKTKVTILGNTLYVRGFINIKMEDTVTLKT